METRDAIISAVQELLFTSRLDELMVNDIVERVGISRPTFYTYFDTKYSVVAAFIREMGRGVFDIWQPVFDGDGPFDEKQIHDAGIGTIQRWREKGALFIATVEGWHTNAEIHDAWNSVLEAFSDALTERIRRSPHPVVNDDLMAAALVSLFERCLYMALIMPDSPFGRSDEELAAMLAHVWTSSLRT